MKENNLKSSKKFSDLATISLILSLLCPLVGLIFGIIALMKINPVKENGKDVIIVSMIVSILFSIFIVLLFIFWFVIFSFSKKSEIQSQNNCSKAYCPSYCTEGKCECVYYDEDDNARTITCEARDKYTTYG